MPIGGVVIQFRAEADKARRDIAKLNASVASVGTTAKKTTSKSGGLGKFAKGAGMAAGLGAVAGGAAGAAYGVVALGRSIVQTSANYEQSQNILRAASDASAAEMKRLSDTAKKMGAETVYSALDASDAMVELAKAGLTVDQIVGGGVQASMNLAATEGLALADAAVAVSNAMAGFGLDAKDLPKVADALAGASKSSTASVDSLMQALQQVGPGARNAGLGLEETVAVLAAFDSMGLKGSDAGTSLKTMLNRLVPQTKKAKEAWESYGLAVYDSKAAMAGLKSLGLTSASSSIDDVTASLVKFYEAQGLKGADASKAAEGWIWSEAMQNQLANADGTFKDASQWAGILKDALGGLSEVDLTEATNLLFGSDAGRAGSIFARLGTEGLQPFLDGAAEAGAAAELADARTAGFNGAIEALKGQMETLAISVGETLLPILTDFVEYLTGEALPKLSEWLDSAEGQTAIQTWADNFTRLGDVIKTIIENIDKLFGLLDKLPGNIVLQKLGLIPKLSSDGPQPKVTRDGVREGARRQGELANAYRYGAGQQVPTIVIDQRGGKQEKIEDSAALAIRIARRTGGATI